MKPWFVVDDAADEYGKGYGTSPPGNLRKAGRLVRLLRQWRITLQ